MRKRNYIIFLLFIILVLSVTVFKIYFNPLIAKHNNINTSDPLTENFTNLLPYKSNYMGDNSNIININNNLPLSQIKKSFYLHPDTLMAEINYNKSTKNIDSEKLQQAIVYNSTANFVLVDNLKTLRLNFTDVSFTISRTSLERWYGTKLSDLQNVSKFNKEVQDKLNDVDYVNNFMEHVVSKS
jgi:hypothetical protein